MKLQVDKNHEQRRSLFGITGGSIIVVAIVLSVQLLGPTSKTLDSFRPINFPSGSENVIFSSKEDALKRWMTEISGAKETSCATAFDKVRSGVWEDPNNDQYLYRRIKTEPHFLVSVHNQRYDPVRYGPIYNNGNYYEGEVIRRFEFILQENRDAFDYDNKTALPLVIDIGGNIGFYTLLSAAWKHAVLTFEINPANIVRLCESLHLNNRNEYGFSELSHSMHVKIHQVGVSNITGQTLRVAVPGNPGETTLENGAKGVTVEKQSQRSFSTTTVTLDDFAAERGWLDRTDTVFSILKIDTEGHELQIILGAQQFIRSRRAKNILMEYRIFCREAMNILLEAGYVVVYGERLANGEIKRRTYTKEESKAFLDAESEKLRNKQRGGKYSDIWLRLDTLTF